MACVDGVDEFRVLGGDPFMNKELHKIVNKLVTYDKCKKVVVYTNAKFVPKGENLSCLKNKKVVLDITDYGASSSASSKFIEVAKKENIAFTTFRCNTWQDCGRIIPFSNKSEKQLEHQFTNCCNSDLISLLHGKLYRCPFSANGVNLNAIPQNKTDEVDLINDQSQQVFRTCIDKYTHNVHFLASCTNTQKVIDSLKSRMTIIKIKALDNCNLKQGIPRNSFTIFKPIIDIFFLIQ